MLHISEYRKYLYLVYRNALHTGIPEEFLIIGMPCAC